ncbi:ribonuclease h2 subunit a putative [Entamoeba histolytica]|uniref:Ribonuclease n=1 Tax=Entamoeba histolytica TaxID=5759 RepID=A0A175JL99_ENTHI|nr:ribonuclease h2 subunit a putative [Entamoeba histolytica]
MLCPLFQNVQTEGEITIGIDEAGRGPVLGPMVYSAFFTTNTEVISTMGFHDSKILSRTMREKLFTDIKESGVCGFSTRILTPSYISQMMCGPQKVSLNEIAFSAVRDIIHQIIRTSQRKIVHIYCDTVGPSKKYQAMIANEFKEVKLSQITVCPKADGLYPVVSAASICAKVTRDTCLDNWIYEETNIQTRQVGCGYPSDVNLNRGVFGWGRKVMKKEKIKGYIGEWKEMELVLTNDLMIITYQKQIEYISLYVDYNITEYNIDDDVYQIEDKEQGIYYIKDIELKGLKEDINSYLRITDDVYQFPATPNDIFN